MLQTDTADGKHAFELAMQYNPVDIEQAADPQAQAFAFSEDPSMDAHKSSWPHWLDKLWQNKPTVASHSLVPQVHAPAFNDDPSTMSHTGITLAEH
jgi:hypothetical protein